MITPEDAKAFSAYRGSFEKFAWDFYGIETSQDMTSGMIDLTGPEELAIAHIVWQSLFNQNCTYMVTAVNARLAHYWCQRVIDAIAILPEYLSGGIKVLRDSITTRTNCLIDFGPCTPWTGRGRTLDGVYVIEPQMISHRTYEYFMQSIIPTMVAGNTQRQIVKFARGY